MLRMRARHGLTYRHRGPVERARRPVAARRGGPRLRQVAHEALLRARQDGQLDRPARQGHRRQAERVRVRPAV